MGKELFFITGNKAKFDEASQIIPSLKQLDVADLPEIQEIDSRKIVEAKLAEASKHSEGELVVEDTSLYINSLNGLPGPLIKWFLKTIGNEGLWKIAETFGSTSAEAKTIVGYKNEQGNISFFEGIVKGKIVPPRGESGFGWDPIFEPEGHNKTFAELGIEEKNKFSMRKLAFEKLKEFMENRTH